MDDLIVKTTTSARMIFAEFAAFYDKAPPDERWELIDGEAIKMPPAKKMHYRIAGNIRDLINARLKVAQPKWCADQEAGIRDRAIDSYAPQPDVTVADRDFPIDQVWTERFYFVVEVLSDDRKDVLEKKRAFYRSHAHCRGFMFVSQTSIAAELVTRTADGWQSRALGAGDEIDIPDIGAIGLLALAYRDTPLRIET